MAKKKGITSRGFGPHARAHGGKKVGKAWQFPNATRAGKAMASQAKARGERGGQRRAYKAAGFRRGPG